MEQGVREYLLIMRNSPHLGPTMLFCVQQDTSLFIATSTKDVWQRVNNAWPMHSVGEHADRVYSVIRKDRLTQDAQSGPGAARTILLIHIIRFLFLQEPKKDIIISAQKKIQTCLIPRANAKHAANAISSRPFLA